MAVHNQPFTQRILAIAELPKIHGKHVPRNSDEKLMAILMPWVRTPMG
jgi:hypothetical protein